MKQLMIVIGIGVTVILASMSVLSIEGKSERKAELERAVAAAVKQTVSHSQIPEQREIGTDDEMVAYFVQLMVSNINADGELEVEVMGVDYKEGMLDVLVTETFKYINGNVGRISVRKCAISQ